MVGPPDNDARCDVYLPRLSAEAEVIEGPLCDRFSVLLNEVPKTIIGPGLRARHRESQRAEAMIACNILNTMIARGKPESFTIAD